MVPLKRGEFYIDRSASSLVEAVPLVAEVFVSHLGHLFIGIMHTVIHVK